MKLLKNMNEAVIYAAYDPESDMVEVFRAPTEDIKFALEDMCQEYCQLTIRGCMDGDHFHIESIYNEIGDYWLNEREIAEMYYQANGPECITCCEYVE